MPLASWTWSPGKEPARSELSRELRYLSQMFFERHLHWRNSLQYAMTSRTCISCFKRTTSLSFSLVAASRSFLDPTAPHTPLRPAIGSFRTTFKLRHTSTKSSMAKPKVLLLGPVDQSVVSSSFNELHRLTCLECTRHLEKPIFTRRTRRTSILQARGLHKRV